jgi:hypothetical protein
MVFLSGLHVALSPLLIYVQQVLRKVNESAGKQGKCLRIFEGIAVNFLAFFSTIQLLCISLFYSWLSCAGSLSFFSLISLIFFSTNLLRLAFSLLN